MATAGAAAGGGGGNAWCGLYNNATDGSYLHVVGLATYIQGSTNGAAVSFAKGLQAGSTPDPPSQPVRFDQAQPWGAPYYINAGPTPVPTSGFMGGWGNGLITTPGWPLWIIPPGYVLWFTAFQVGADIGCIFWYLPILD